jgi:hypothetical protein
MNCFGFYNMIIKTIPYSKRNCKVINYLITKPFILLESTLNALAWPVMNAKHLICQSSLFYLFSLPL